jgi:hypothetical protein
LRDARDQAFQVRESLDLSAEQADGISSFQRPRIKRRLRAIPLRDEVASIFESTTGVHKLFAQPL